MSKEFNEQELIDMGLSPTEIEALREDHDEGDGTDEDNPDGAAGAAGGGDGGDGAQGGGDGNQGGAAAGAAAGADDDAARQAAEAATAQAAQAAADQATQAAAQQAAAAAAAAPDPRAAEIGNELAALDARFDDGELTAAEYRAEQTKLNAEREELVWKERSAKLRDDIKFEERQNAWATSVQTWLAKPENAAAYPHGSLPFQALDRAVMTLQDQARQAGKSDIDPSLLDAAHKEVRRQFGMPDTPAAAADDAAAQAAAAAAAQQQKPRKPAPLTLANVPASAGTETSDQRWAHLDRLMDNPNPEDPDAYERAVASLTPEARAEYLAAR